MKPKIDEIIEKLSGLRAYSDESYIMANHLIIFLLFGCKDGTKALFEKRIKSIAFDYRAAVFLQVENTVDLVTDVQAIVDSARNIDVDFKTLNVLHICPFVLADSAEPKKYEECTAQIDEHMKSRHVEVLWKPFIVVDFTKEDAAAWLEAISVCIKQQAGEVYKLCVMTKEDDTGLILNEARLVDTALLIAIIHANQFVGKSLSGQIVYRSADADNYFYTAQSIFISNPINMRTLNCIHYLLERLLVDDKIQKDLSLSFIQDILTPRYAQLPIENDRVTFVPLYGVMPNPDKDLLAFSARLEEFAHKYYLAAFEFNKEDWHKRFRRALLREFVQSGKPVDYLYSLNTNNEEIEKLIGKDFTLQTNKLVPISTKGGMLEEHMDIYADVEKDVRDKLDNMAINVFKGFLESEDYKSLPRLLSDSRKRIKNISIDFYEAAVRIRRSGEEIQVELNQDPDAGLVDYAAKDPTNKAFFNECLEVLTFALDENNQAAINSAEIKLVDNLLEAVSSLKDPDSARDFMALLSRTCHNAQSDAAQKCVVRISDRFKFPLRLEGRGQKRTFVWGSKDNHLFGVWEQRHDLFDTLTDFLEIETRERIVLLTVSHGFGISGIVGAKK